MDNWESACIFFSIKKVNRFIGPVYSIDSYDIFFDEIIHILMFSWKTLWPLLLLVDQGFDSSFCPRPLGRRELRRWSDSCNSSLVQQSSKNPIQSKNLILRGFFLRQCNSCHQWIGCGQVFCIQHLVYPEIWKKKIRKLFAHIYDLWTDGRRARIENEN